MDCQALHRICYNLRPVDAYLSATEAPNSNLELKTAEPNCVARVLLFLSSLRSPTEESHANRFLGGQPISFIVEPFLEQVDHQ